MLFRSKTSDYFIYSYSRDGESVAIMLNKNTTSCGKKIYHTGIPGVHVVLLKENESILDNKGLSLVELEDDIILEAEIRGAMNSV